MKRHQLRKLVLASGAAILGLTGSPGAMAACGINVDTTQLGGWIEYGDAQSYSLPIANYVGGYGTKGPYSVKISDGKDCMWVAIDQNGSFLDFAGAEKPYSTVNGEKDPYFATAPETYRGVTGTVNNPVSTAWDVSLLALRDYLTPVSGGDTYDPVFLFQNNQENAVRSCGGVPPPNGTAEKTFCQSLAAWARIWVTDDTGADIGLNLLFNNQHEGAQTPQPYALFTEGGGGLPFGDVFNYTSADTAPFAPVTDPLVATDFVLSGGAICLASSSVNPLLPFLGAPCSGLPPALVFLGYDTLSPPIAHNLGNDEFPYVENVPELNLFLSLAYAFLTDAQLAQWTMHIDARLGCENNENTPIASSSGDPRIPGGPWGNCLNNGGESIVIGYGRALPPPPPPVAEPATIAMTGLALLAMAGFRRRQTLQRI